MANRVGQQLGNYHLVQLLGQLLLHLPMTNGLFSSVLVSCFRSDALFLPPREVCRSQQPSWLDNRSLAMDPLRLNPVEPRALDGQPAESDFGAE